MKKLWVLLMCVVVCLGLIACNTEQADDSDRDDEVSAVATQTNDVESTSSVSLEQFIQLVQPQLESMKDTLEESGLKIEVVARGNSLVYSYQYTIDLDDLSAVRAALEESMDAVSSTFENVLDQLQSAVPDAESVIVEYLSKDGQLIYSKEYK